MKLEEIGRQVGCRVVGDGAVEITGLAPIEQAGEGELTFLSNRKYRKYLATTKAAAVITDDESNLRPDQSGMISDNPYLTFAQALWLFHRPLSRRAGVDPRAVVAETARIGENVSIGAFKVIGDRAVIGDNVTIHSHCAIYDGAEIGPETTIYSHCVVREGCRVGSRVILQNHVTIGGDGFGFARQSDGGWFKIPQTGIVVIEDDVEIGAGSAIDRGTIGETVIGNGTKIDNLVQIGHGSSVGSDTLLCAQVGLAGSTKVGNRVILSGQVGAAGHLTIGDGVIATAQTGIPNSVEAGKVVSGYPAIDNRDWLKSSAVFAQLPQIIRELRGLRDRLQRLEEASGKQDS